MSEFEAIDCLLQHFTSGEFSDEVSNARLEFNELTGGPFDQSAEDFEMKMSQFADWYLFVRKHSTKDLAPMDMPEAEPVTSEKCAAGSEVFGRLKSSRNSLFEFIKVKNEDVFIKDLFENEKIVIPSSAVSLGFQKEEIFQARLIPREESFVFSPSFCFHPAPAGKFILKEIKKVRKIKEATEKIPAQRELILKVFKMKYKLHQYKHVNVKDIYSLEPKLRF